MSQMTEEEKQKIETLLKLCRRQTSEIERDQKDWEERHKAMKAEQEHQQRKSQQTKPESGETSGEGPSTSILKVKSQKGKTIEIMQVEVDKPAEKSHKPSPEIGDKSKRKDKSARQDEPTEQEENDNESDTPPVEFEDQMYELMQETEMMTEYQEMTSEQEE